MIVDGPALAAHGHLFPSLLGLCGGGGGGGGGGLHSPTHFDPRCDIGSMDRNLNACAIFSQIQQLDCRMRI